MKILSVDDVSMIRQIIKKAVENMGGVFLEASDGIEALSVLEKNEGKVDLILCDWNMPKMDGFHFLKNIKTDPRYRRIPVVMVTTANEKDKIIQAVQAGANNYLIKPFTDQQLTNKIMDCLNPKHKRLEICILDALKNVLKLITRDELSITEPPQNQEQAKEAAAMTSRQGQFFNGQLFVFGEMNAVVLLTLDKQSAAKLVSQLNNSQSAPDQIWEEEIVAGVAKFSYTLVENAKIILDKAEINVQVKAPLTIAGYISDTHNLLFNSSKTPFMTSKVIQAGEIIINQKIFFI